MELAKKTVSSGVDPSVVQHAPLELSFHCEAAALKFVPEPGRTFYDATNKELVTMNETELIRYPSKDEKETRIAIQNRGKPIRNVVFSPQPHEYICIQRSDTEIEFTIIARVRTFIKSVRKPRESKILGIHWTFRANLIVITTHTVELYQVDTSGQLKLLKYYNVDVNWYKYAARNKILLVASGPGSSNLWNFVFKEDLVFRIPRFDLPFAVRSDQVVLSQVYANVYIMVIDHAVSQVRMFTLTKDAVKPAMALNLGAKANFALNVVDNLVAVHNLDAKVTFLFDIQWIDPTYPVSGPLPMTGGGGADLYSALHQYIVPNVILNETHGMLWTVELRVEDIVKAISTESLATLEFLVRRSRSKALILEHLKRLIISNSSLRLLAASFNSLNSVVASLPPNLQKQLISMSPVRVSTDSSSAAAASSSSSAAPSSQEVEDAFVARRTTRGEMIVDQRDVYADVFTKVLEKESCDEKYFSAVLLEYVRSLDEHKIEIELFLFEMLIGLLVKTKQFVQLQMLFQYYVVDDSLPVAFQLLSISKADCPAAQQLALDMLRRLKKHDVIVDVLLTGGQVLAALRYITDNVTIPASPASLNPKRFLDAAPDSRVYFTVFRFFDSLGYSFPPEYVHKFSKEFAIGKQ